MVITYMGKQCFKVQYGETILAFNPISKSSKNATATRFGSHIALSTTRHPDYNGFDQVSYGDTEPFAIEGPGDYEVKGVFIKGVASVGSSGINTIYTLTLDGINIAFLGALADDKLSPEAKEAIGEADIIFVPIGGGDVLDSATAAKLALSFDSKIIIPMDYGSDRASGALKTFLKEGGKEDVASLDKLTVKRKDLEGKEGEIVVLSS